MEEKIKPLQHIYIRQVKEMAEIFTDFETRNHYQACDPQGTSFAYIKEADENTRISRQTAIQPFRRQRA